MYSHDLNGFGIDTGTLGLIPLNTSTFARGQSWQPYLESMTANRILLERKVAEFRLEDPSPFQNSSIRSVLVFTEDWCQDSVTAFPPLIAIAHAATLELRIMRRSNELALHQSLTGLEYPPIPTFVFYDSAWQERGRFIEMPHAFRHALQDPNEALWVREMYDELWWSAEVEELAVLFQERTT
jgi:hypothetical protein